MSTFKISATTKAGFWRCSTFFPYAGKIVDHGDFDGDQWDVLNAEKGLTVVPAKDDDDAQALDRQVLIRSAIETLGGPDDFQGGDGKPKAGGR